VDAMSIESFRLNAGRGQGIEVARARAAADEHGAFISVLDEPTATSASARIHPGVLAGIPFAVKDNIDTKDLPTTGGTEALRGSRPRHDAEVVARLIGAGAVMIGKTNLHELAFGITGNNGSFGPVRNPYDPTRSAGGSSSGSAVAVAVGIVPFALGTDTGGSVRIPAAHCGIVGLRPTVGRYPASGVVRLSSTRDTIGVMASSVADVALVDGVITGETDYVEPELLGLRLGMPTYGFLDDLDPEVASSLAATRKALEAAGIVLVNVPTERLHELNAACGFPITFYESDREIADYLSQLDEPYCELTLSEVTIASKSSDVRQILETMKEAPVSVQTYTAALGLRSDLQHAYASLFVDNEIAALVYPTVALLPPPLGDDDTTRHNGRPVPVFDMSIRNTGPGSVAGIPAVSIPSGRTETGVPIGLSLEGAAGTDRRLLGLAGAVASLLNA
jgi:Asp-tRNA(Asn)/Glu-tRNA(Gln) amidotransferase A subunit family amidase